MFKTTLVRNTMSSVNAKSDPIALGKLAYLRAGLSGLFHDAMLSLFLRLAEKEQFSKAQLAKSIKKSPAQITRWLSAPSNFTLDTISDVLAGMGYEVESIRLVNRTTNESLQYPELSSTIPSNPTEKPKPENKSYPFGNPHKPTHGISAALSPGHAYRIQEAIRASGGMGR